jgi:hypothetical protein
MGECITRPQVLPARGGTVNRLILIPTPTLRSFQMRPLRTLKTTAEILTANRTEYGVTPRRILRNGNTVIFQSADPPIADRRSQARSTSVLRTKRRTVSCALIGQTPTDSRPATSPTITLLMHLTIAEIQRTRAQDPGAI